MAKPEAQFLHQQNPNLHHSAEVETVADYLRAGDERIPNDPSAKIEAYLGFLASEDYVNDGILSGNHASIDRQVEAASVDLTPENAHAYVKFQARVARERGHGDVIDPDVVDEHEKMNALRHVRTDQQKQLGEWAQELNSTENKYPDWFKYWMFENVKRHTEFNEDLGKNGQPKGFEKRSSSSFVLFPELDRESVSLVYDALIEKFGGQPMGFEYDRMRQLVGKANFAELYGEAQNYGFKITDKLKEITTGSWQDFKQSDKASDAQALSDLVRSYRTGWCTAGSETAAIQLQGGDFYVWCSANPETGKDEVPRIAVRMENGVIAEVRGVVGGRKQELEPQLMDTVMAKIGDLPGGEVYFEKAENMKRVTTLEKLLVADPQTVLTRADVRFLYELDGPVIGFGYGAYGGFGRDPRIDELKALRGQQDHGVLRELAVEHLRESFEASYQGYATIAEQLNAMRGRRDRISLLSQQELAELYDQKMTEWQESGVLDYVAERIVTHGELHMPIARPNIVASVKEIKQLAHNFAKGQGWNEAYIYNQLYDQYATKDELAMLSGYDPASGPVVFSLISKKYSPELGARPIKEQQETLYDLQNEHPTINLHVPSVLDAPVFWQTLRAAGDTLMAGDVWGRTAIRHFNVTDKQLGGFRVVPDSYVADDGRPRLDFSGVGGDGGSRLALG